MKTLRVGLAIFLLIYSVLTLLSGLDIYQGTEPDLSTEWIIVGIFFIVCMALILINLRELIKVKR